MKVSGNKQVQVLDPVFVTKSQNDKSEIKQKPVSSLNDKVQVSSKKGDVSSTGINLFTEKIAVDNTYVAPPAYFFPSAVKSSSTGKINYIVQKNGAFATANNMLISGTVATAKTLGKIGVSLVEKVSGKTIPVFHDKKLSDAGTYIDLAKKEPGDYIFLFNSRTGVNIDWSSPTNLARTTALSAISKGIFGDASAVGHAQVGWVSNDGKGHIISGGAGETGQHGGEGAKAALSGWGLNVMEMVFLDGHLESKQEVLDRIKLADDRKGFSWMAIKTDHNTLMKMVNFIQEFDKSGAAKNYGFPLDPLKFQGAGCTSFANASFYKTDLNIPIFEASKRKINLPLQYMGKRTEPVPNTRSPELASGSDQEKKVSTFNILFNKVNWASESEPHKDFEFFDPELYYESMIEMENVVRKESNMELKPFSRTKELDASQKKVKEVSENWVKGLMSNNVPIKIATIHNTSGLVIDLTRQGKNQKEK